MSDTHEIWKPIREVNGMYSISNQGRVRNNQTGNILRNTSVKKNYCKVNLKINGKVYQRLVHRLVATEFIPNPENKPEVNHKNGIHNDNRLDNLEWVTGEENRKHAYETGLTKHKDARYSGYLYGVWHRNHKNDMCDEWQDFIAFYSWCNKNGYAQGKYVYKIDSNNAFSPSNCAFANYVVHYPLSKDKLKRTYECFGELLSIKEISEKYHITPETFIYRVKKGMSTEDAVIKPLVKSGRPKKCEQQQTEKNITSGSG